MERITDWINQNSTLVQAISSVLSVIIIFFTLVFTIIYVVATWRLVHLPYKSYIKPSNIKSGNNLEKWYIFIKNFGPGVATNVKISCKRVKIIRRESNNKDFFSYNEYTMLIGDSELQNNEEKFFTLNGLVSFPVELKISWSSITGKKYTSYWKLSENTLFTQPPQRITITNRVLSFIKRLIFYPYIIISKRRYMELDFTKYLILKRLNTDGKLTYDFIADKLTKSDEETKAIINKLMKEGYILINNDEEAVISDNGVMKLKKLEKKYCNKGIGE